MADGDRSSLFGEIRRFARTSGAVGGIAARVGAERLGLSMPSTKAMPERGPPRTG